MLWESWYLKHIPFLQVTFFILNWKLRSLPVRVIIVIVWNILYCHLFQHRVRYVPNFPTLKGDVTHSFPCPLSALYSPFPCEPLSLYRAGAGYICAFLLTLTEYRLHSPLNHQSDCPPPPWTQLTVGFGQRWLELAKVQRNPSWGRTWWPDRSNTNNYHL